MKNSIQLLSVLSLQAALSAQAQFAGTSSGTFQNPVGPPGMLVLGVNTSSIRIGDGGTSGVGPTILTFAGGSFATAAETPFALGSLTYFNGTIAGGSEANSVDLNLHLSFTTPSGLTKDFIYPLNLIYTLNGSGTPEGDADFVTLPSFSSTIFTDHGINYTLQVGFGAFTGQGFLVGNEFHVFEGASATAPVLGTITQNISAVPDGCSTAFLLMPVSVVLITLARGIRRQAVATKCAAG